MIPAGTTSHTRIVLLALLFETARTHSIQRNLSWLTAFLCGQNQMAVGQPPGALALSASPWAWQVPGAIFAKTSALPRLQSPLTAILDDTPFPLCETCRGLARWRSAASSLNAAGRWAFGGGEEVITLVKIRQNLIQGTDRIKEATRLSIANIQPEDLFVLLLVPGAVNGWRCTV